MSGRAGDWIGVSGQIITRVTAQFDAPVAKEELDIMFQCKMIQVATGGRMKAKP